MFSWNDVVTKQNNVLYNQCNDLYSFLQWSYQTLTQLLSLPEQHRRSLPWVVLLSLPNKKALEDDEIHTNDWTQIIPW